MIKLNLNTFYLLSKLVLLLRQSKHMKMIEVVIILSIVYIQITADYIFNLNVTFMLMEFSFLIVYLNAKAGNNLMT